MRLDQSVFRFFDTSATIFRPWISLLLSHISASLTTVTFSPKYVFAYKHLTYVLVMKVYDWWYNRYSMDHCRLQKVKNTLHHCCVG